MSGSTHSWRLRMTVFFTCVVSICLNSEIVSAQDKTPLRYKGKKGQEIAYNVEITADLTDRIETLKGIISYKVNDGNGNDLNLTYRGGLAKTSKAKPGSSSGSSRPGFGRRRFGPPSFARGPRGPFASVPFKGLTTTSNKITLTSQGATQTMTGDSQLPYLLGNLSLLIFEPLPKEAKKTWVLASGVTISSKNERQSGPPYFGRFPGSPFNREEPESKSSGSQSTSFTVVKDEGKLVRANKSYQLKSPSTDKGSYEILGTGKWVFNREEGVSESLDFKQNLKVKTGNVTVTLPVTIKYQRMSAKELADHREKQKIRLAELQKRSKELREKQAKARAKKAAAPFTAKEKQEILDGLLSEKFFNVIRALQKLNGKSTKKPDQEIAEVVQELLNHDNRSVQRLAKQAAVKWPVDKK